MSTYNKFFYGELQNNYPVIRCKYPSYHFHWTKHCQKGFWTSHFFLSQISFCLQTFKSYWPSGNCNALLFLNVDAFICFFWHTLQIASGLSDPSEFLPLDPSQDPIFPPELQVSRNLSHLMTKPTKWHVHPAKTQRSAWAELSLCCARSHFVGFVMRRLICKVLDKIV